MTTVRSPSIKPNVSDFADRIQRRHRMVIEEVSIDQRLKWEREFAAEPVRKHSELIYQGYWLIASQLKIDHAMGRLDGQS